jgi:hypothetical protein
VIHSLDRAAELLQEDAVFKQRVEKLRKLLEISSPST